jgi:hypothetical protein
VEWCNGVDYLSARADGRVEIHIHAQITTEDGKKIALYGARFPDLTAAR